MKNAGIWRNLTRDDATNYNYVYNKNFSVSVSQPDWRKAEFEVSLNYITQRESRLPDYAFTRSSFDYMMATGMPYDPPGLEGSFVGDLICFGVPSLVRSGLSASTTVIANNADDVAINLVDDFVSSYSRPIYPLKRVPEGEVMKVGNKLYKGGQLLPAQRIHFGRGATGANLMNFSAEVPVMTLNASRSTQIGVAASGSGLIIYEGVQSLINQNFGK